MNKYILSTIKIVLLFSLYANTYSSEIIRVAFGEALAPWVIPSRNTGILVDVLRKTLETEGYVLKTQYLPYARRLSVYKNGAADVVIDINQSVIEAEELPGYFSGEFYAYENFAISLKERKYEIQSISDLTKYSVLSWQGARSRLGPEYKEMTENNKRYKEIHNQRDQVKLLGLGRYDVIQMDYQIFLYNKNLLEIEQTIDKTKEYALAPIFGKSKNGFLFKDEKLRDLFIKNLKKLREDLVLKDIILFSEIQREEL